MVAVYAAKQTAEKEEPPLLLLNELSRMSRKEISRMSNNFLH
jgi:hypothetical protein